MRLAEASRFIILAVLVAAVFKIFLCLSFFGSFEGDFGKFGGIIYLKNH